MHSRVFSRWVPFFLFNFARENTFFIYFSYWKARKRMLFCAPCEDRTKDERSWKKDVRRKRGWTRAWISYNPSAWLEFKSRSQILKAQMRIESWWTSLRHCFDNVHMDFPSWKIKDFSLLKPFTRFTPHWVVFAHHRSFNENVLNGYDPFFIYIINLRLLHKCYLNSTRCLWI